MKKEYIAPKAKGLTIVAEGLVATSPGVATGQNLGNEYGSEDVSYSNRRNHSIWDN